MKKQPAPSASAQEETPREALDRLVDAIRREVAALEATGGAVVGHTHLGRIARPPWQSDDAFLGPLVG